MIKFGTGGWRAIIGEDFTKENIQRLAQAIAGHCQNQSIVIGYDRRFLSDMAAQWLAEVFAANQVHVLFIAKPVPTPVTMFAVKTLNSAYGIAVTASHNPALYNGIKVFTRGGKDAYLEVTQEFEQDLLKIGTIKQLPFDAAMDQKAIELIDPMNDYIDSILAVIDTQAIRNAHLKVLIDPMHGVSKTSLSIILNTARCDVDIINDRHDTLFGGKLPSPSSATLHKLSEMVVSNHYDLGIATDGDADRIGIIDEDGHFVHPNMLIALLYFYLLENKHQKGAVVRNLSTTHLLDAIARDHDEICYETPVGFKYISETMEKEDALIGGESSGGLTIRGHIQGKDGIYAATLLVEMISITHLKLKDMISAIEDRYGKRYFEEHAYSFSEAKKHKIQKILFEHREIPSFSSAPTMISYVDGLKICFPDDSWVSARFSGTEPLLRIFSESKNESFSIELIQSFEHFLSL